MTKVSIKPCPAIVVIRCLFGSNPIGPSSIYFVPVAATCRPSLASVQRSSCPRPPCRCTPWSSCRPCGSSLWRLPSAAARCPSPTPAPLSCSQALPPSCVPTSRHSVKSKMSCVMGINNIKATLYRKKKRKKKNTHTHSFFSDRTNGFDWRCLGHSTHLSARLWLGIWEVWQNLLRSWIKQWNIQIRQHNPNAQPRPPTYHITTYFSV